MGILGDHKHSPILMLAQYHSVVAYLVIRSGFHVLQSRNGPFQSADFRRKPRTVQSETGLAFVAGEKKLAQPNVSKVRTNRPVWIWPPPRFDNAINIYHLRGVLIPTKNPSLLEYPDVSLTLTKRNMDVDISFRWYLKHTLCKIVHYLNSWII